MATIKEGQERGKGFEGLSSLVSDIETSDAPVKMASEHPKADPSSSNKADHSTSQSAPKPLFPPAEPSPRSSIGNWVLGIAATFGILFYIGEAIRKVSNSPPSQPAPVAASTTATSPALPSPVSPAPTITPQELPSRPEEVMPPVGKGLVLETSQIRYCLAEDIRLDAAKSAVNNYNDADVDRYNAMAADYNSRCGSFRYRSGALEGAQRDIGVYRDELRAEGTARFVRSFATGSVSAPAESGPVPDATVQAIQRKLKQLGYEVGTADGLLGRGTRSAIVAFQRDNGLATTGVADQSLLLQLQQAPSRSTGGGDTNKPVAPSTRPRSATTATALPPTSAQSSGPTANSWVSGSNWYCNDGYRKVGSSCEKLVVPTHAWVSGSNWYCNDGFRKVGDQCIALNVPDNAWVSGPNWYCNDGYRKNGDRCEKLNVPPNAWVSGPNWYCKDGFQKVEEQCVALNVPDNAWVSGSNWYCNDGYRKVGDKCVSIFQQ